MESFMSEHRSEAEVDRSSGIGVSALAHPEEVDE
jgi:hypothetical protein